MFTAPFPAPPLRAADSSKEFFSSLRLPSPPPFLQADQRVQPLVPVASSIPPRFSDINAKLGRTSRSRGTSTMTDRNLLFGVLALQADLIDVRQFAEACTVWASRKTVPLSGVLIERGPHG